MTAQVSAFGLEHRFARELPELAVAWHAADAPDPRLLVLDDALARSLGLDPGQLRSPAGLRFLVGPQARGDAAGDAAAVAQGYAGHQFGHLQPRLGDGRALLLGELTDPEGRVRDLHLKGSGPTPFSRGGDGFAVVGPMLREYVVSRAMHALGIPTTRALAVVATGRTVYREGAEPGAVLARVAASHLRVGSFQYARLTGDDALLRRLAEHAIARHHPAAAADEQPALALFGHVVSAQARLVAQWMLVGFVHGVMNTDNMTISGETIDYGPCAFLDAYDPATVFSSIDTAGRYAYGNQPAAAQWNLARFAESLLPLLDDDVERAVATATTALDRFAPQYEAAFATGLAAKLGLAGTPGVDGLAADLLPLLAADRADWTSTFRALAEAARGDDRPVLTLAPTLGDWLQRWRAAGPDPAAMDRVNPVYIARNHLVEQALTAATAGDLGPLHDLLDVLGRPYDVRPGRARYAAPDPDGGAGYRTFCGT